MRHIVILGVLVAVSAGCGVDTTGPVSAPESTAAVAVGVSGGSTQFCTLARQIGQDNLGLTQTDADPAAVLRNIDRLAAAAPSDLAADMAVVDQLEHRTLDPTGNPNPGDLGNGRTRAALQHFADYLRDTCHIPVAAPRR